MGVSGECEILSCHREARKVVFHPGREAERMALCEDHAATVAEDIEDGEVVGDVQ